jgi:O-antigen ligase
VMQGVLDTSAMVAAAWIFTDIKKIPRVMRLVVYGCIFTMLVTLLENYMQHPPWLGYTPSFMKIDPILYETYVSPQARVGDGRYRVRATFGIVLYYSQYLGLVFPALLYEMWKMKGWKRVLAIALVPLILQTVWFVNARTASIALLISLFGFAGLVMIRQLFFRSRGDALKPGIMVALVLLAVAALAGAIASSHRLQMYTIGGQQHAGSNAVRDQQWEGAWRAVRKNPIGVGMGTPLPDVGAVSTKGIAIVDSFFINLLVGVGPLGFIGFMGCIARIAWLGVMTFMRAKDDVEEWSGAMALAVINFIVAAYVISFADNIYLLFTMCVGILALHRHQSARIAAETPTPTALPSPSTALVRRR